VGHRIQTLLATSVLEEQLAQMRNAVVCGLCQLLDLKDLNTGVHSTRLAEWSVRIADQLGMDEEFQRDVEVAALLHYIGKVGIPDSVLRKAGHLTEDEFRRMQKHPEFGWSVLRLLPGFERVSLFVLHHGESQVACARLKTSSFQERMTSLQRKLAAFLVSS
jgi:HD-GYP domain-containing protein (c-di-GMP phosphodiesterase class II)